MSGSVADDEMLEFFAQRLPASMIGEQVDWTVDVIVSTGNAEYRLIGQLGKGASGTVYAAVVHSIFEDPDSGQPLVRDLAVDDRVAIKQQNMDNDQTKDEVEILSALKGNPGACAVASCLLDYGTNEDTRVALLVIELMDYASDLFRVVELLAVVPRNKATRTYRIAVIKKMLTAISTLHGLGVYHRDIKPENFAIGEIEHLDGLDMIDAWKTAAILREEPIFDDADTNLERYIRLRQITEFVDKEFETTFLLMLADSVVVKAIDFGLSAGERSKIVGGSTPMVGTPLYADPWLIATHKRITREHPFEAEADIWRSADTWSAGATAYSIFYGDNVFPVIDDRVPVRDITATPEYKQTRHITSGLVPRPSRNTIRKFVTLEIDEDLEDFVQFYRDFTRAGRSKPRRGALVVSPIKTVSNEVIRQEFNMLEDLDAAIKDAERDPTRMEELEDLVRSRARFQKSLELHVLDAGDYRAIAFIEDFLQLNPLDRAESIVPDQ